MKAEIEEQVTLTLLDDPEQPSMAGLINGADRNGILRLTLDRSVAEGKAVRIEAGPKYSATGRVLYSLLRDRRYYVTVQTDAAGRRREPRIEAAEDATVVSIESHRTPLNCEARVVDVSKSGLGLISRASVSPGVLVRITLNAAIVFGTVRHCSPQGNRAGGFKIGVEIETVIFRDDDEQPWVPSSLRELWAFVRRG